MIKKPFRVFLGDREVRGTSRYNLVLIGKKIREGGVNPCSVRVVKEEVGKATVTETGVYMITGRLRPTLYHLSGDNPLGCPTKPVYREKAPRSRESALGLNGPRLNGQIYFAFNDCV
jgi:hypothetical protein